MSLCTDYCASGLETLLLCCIFLFTKESRMRKKESTPFVYLFLKTQTENVKNMIN